MMQATWRRALAVVFLLGLVTSSTCRAADPVPIQLQEHRVEIREALLKETPLGSSSAQVRAVILKRLDGEKEKLPPVENHPAVGPEAEKPKNRGVKSVRLALGQYYEHPELTFLSAPLLSSREVTAQWAFDANDRLVDIFIDKLTSVY